MVEAQIKLGKHSPSYKDIHAWILFTRNVINRCKKIRGTQDKDEDDVGLPFRIKNKGKKVRPDHAENSKERCSSPCDTPPYERSSGQFFGEFIDFNVNDVVQYKSKRMRKTSDDK